ncbi:hypothetical protein ACFXBB_10995 [Streptomyces scopuliridis]|uniref:hypothetical protein n=1 Tax=Streptomyces scopuliridis TaxID=452529 RepID=UPI0036BDA12B
MYDGEVAAARARELRAALPGWAAVYYAAKANSFPGVVRALARTSTASKSPPSASWNWR